MMDVCHVFELKAKCPVDDANDVYTVEIMIDRTVPVEDIVAKSEMIAMENPIYQEDLTKKLSDVLDASVRTRGLHMRGKVQTTCLVFR